MGEFDKLRALLDIPRSAQADPVDVAEARAPTERRMTSPKLAHSRSAPATIARTLRRRLWTRLLWRILVAVTVLDAIRIGLRRLEV